MATLWTSNAHDADLGFAQVRTDSNTYGGTSCRSSTCTHAASPSKRCARPPAHAHFNKVHLDDVLFRRQRDRGNSDGGEDRTPTYRQMAIRQQKVKDWAAVAWWAERGISLYGADAARQEAVEDLEKRRNRAHAALAAAQGKGPAPRPRADDKPLNTTVADASGEALPQQAGEIEILICQQCANTFERIRVRGRKPRLCPTCRAT